MLINVLRLFVFGVVRMTEYEKLRLERLERERVAKASQDDALRRYQARMAAIAAIDVADRYNDMVNICFEIMNSSYAI